MNNKFGIIFEYLKINSILKRKWFTILAIIWKYFELINKNTKQRQEMRQNRG